MMRSQSMFIFLLSAHILAEAQKNWLWKAERKKQLKQTKEITQEVWSAAVYRSVLLILLYVNQYYLLKISQNRMKDKK